MLGIQKKPKIMDLGLMSLDDLLAAQTTRLSPEILTLIKEHPRETAVCDPRGEYLYSQPCYMP